MPNLATALKRYLKLMREAAYFDAHEILEEVWHPMRKSQHPQQNLIKGLINAAIAFEHLKRNRVDAQRKAHRVMVSYERHKPLLHVGIPHHALFAKACEMVEQLKEDNETFRTPML